MVFLLQYVPEGIFAAVSGTQTAGLSMYDLKKLYDQKKKELDAQSVKKSPDPAVETDGTVTGAKAELSPAEKVVRVSGKSVYGEGSLVSIVIKGLDNSIIYSMTDNARDNGNFSIDVPSMYITRSDYKIVVDSRKKTINSYAVTLPSKQDITQSVYGSVYGESLISDIQTVDAGLISVDSEPQQQTVDSSITYSAPSKSINTGTASTFSATASDAVSSSITVTNPKFVTSTGAPIIVLTSGAAMYFNATLTNSSSTTATAITTLRLRKPNGDITYESSSTNPVGPNSSTNISANIPARSYDLTGYYLTADIVDSTNSCAISDTLRCPLSSPQNLEGGFVLNGSSPTDNVILKWDEVPNAQTYNVYRNVTGQAIQVNTNPLTRNDFINGYQVYIGDTNGSVNTFYVCALSANSVSTSSSLDVYRGTTTYTSQNIQFNNDSIFQSLSISSSTINVNGKTIKSYGKLYISGSSTLNFNSGKVYLLNNSDFQMMDTSQMLMTNSSDYLLVEGQFDSETSTNHTSTQLSNGTIEVKGTSEFKWLNGQFRPGGNHRVKLTGISNSNLTVNLGSDTDVINSPATKADDFKRRFNILTLNKPFGTGYTWNNTRLGRIDPNDWCITLDGQSSSSFYNGIDGIYPPSGNFSRTYTDMTLSAPGFPFNIGRIYNSNYSNKSPARAWTIGKGWSFSYEGSIEEEPVSQGTTKYKDVYLPGNQRLRFSYPAAGGSFTAEDSRATLTYNNGLYTLIMKDKTQYIFTASSSAAWLTSIIDMYGNTITINVDLNTGRVQNVVDITQRKFVINYNASNQIYKIDDSLSSGTVLRSIYYNYTNGQLSSVTDTLGNIVYKYYYSIDTLQLMKITDGTDRLIESVSYQSPDEGKVTKSVDAFGKASTYQYQSGNTITTETDTDGTQRQTTYGYDANLAVNTVKYSDNTSIAAVYETYGSSNKYNEPKSVTDRNGNTTTYTRDTSTGDVTKITNPDGSEKNYGYCSGDLSSILKWELDEEGNFTYYDYYTTRLLNHKYVYRHTGVTASTAATLVPSGESDSNYIVTKYTYYSPASVNNMTGLVNTLTNKFNITESAITTYDYTSEGLVQTVTDAALKVTSYQYDSYRNQKKVQKAFGTATSGGGISVLDSSYDTNGRLEKTDLYDNAASGTKNTTRYVYDINGRLIQKIAPNQYNSANDNLAGHSYNDSTVGYRYTYFGTTDKMSKQTDPENNTTIYHKYDAYGNLTREQKPPNNPGYSSTDIDNYKATAFDYTYDIFNRITKVKREISYNLNSDGTISPSAYEDISSISYTTAAGATVSGAGITAGNVEVKRETRNFDSTNSGSTDTYTDYAGRTIQTTGAYGTTYQAISINTYFKNGKLKTSTDPNGYTTYYDYGYDGSTGSATAGFTAQHVFTPVENASGTINYKYIRSIFDDSGNKINEYTRIATVTSGAISLGGTGIEAENVSTGYYKSSYLYNGNGTLKESADYSNAHKKIYYDDGNVLRRTEEFSTSTNAAIVTEYKNGFLGKPLTKNIYARAGDIESNDYTSNTSVVLTYTYYYDSNGNVTMIINPHSANQLISNQDFFYDNLDRVKCKDVMDDTNNITYSTSTTYNWAGNPVTQTDSRGNITYYKYNWKGLPIEVKKNVAVWNGSADVNQDCITQYDYDRQGRKILEVSPTDIIRQTLQVHSVRQHTHMTILTGY